MAGPGAIVELPPEPCQRLLDELAALVAPVVRSMVRARARARSVPDRHPAGDSSNVGLATSLLFLRLAEERGIERPGTLRDLGQENDIGAKLVALLDGVAERCHVRGLQAPIDARAARSRHGHPLAHADDGPLRDLLAFFDSREPTELATLPADALGRCYERSRQSETRKTHGVFYTPPHVVDYVVERTVGRALADQDGAARARVRVLDPACGSGAFLLGAYRHLLDWHSSKGDGVPLSRACRVEILQNGVFGVDVDSAAIEVAKLSLLLACFDPVRRDDREAGCDAALALPRLEANFRAGHALIDPDDSEPSTACCTTKPRGSSSSHATAEHAPRDKPKNDRTAPARAKNGHAARKTHPFESERPLAWQRAFPEIFAEGGFDVVIGNPPYLSFGGRHAVDISSELRRYYAEHYESGGWPTAHSLFLERSVKLLSRRFVSFVVPDQVGHLGGYRSARAIAQREAGLVEVRYWGERVFRGVTTPALTIILDKEKKNAPTEVVDRDGSSRCAVFQPGDPWSVSARAALIERLRRDSFSLGKLVGDCGIRTTSSRDQVVGLPAAGGNIVPVLEGKLVGRYGCRPPTVGVRLDSERPLFVSRPERYREATFVIRQTASYPIVGPREHALYFRNSLLALFAPANGIDVHYLVALLNSKLLRFVYTETVREAQQRTFPQVKVKALQSLPLRKLDVTSIADKRRHDAVVELARSALDAQARALAASATDEERHWLGRFDAIDRELDTAVYDLYELSREEREAVEDAFA